MAENSKEEQYRNDIYLKAKNDFDEKLSESEITMCIVTEEHEGLSFFHNHIWPARRMGTLKWEKTIDGFRVLAARNGLCRVDEPEWVYDPDFEPEDSARKGPDGLYACKLSIWRRSASGRVEGPFIGVAHYHEYVQLKKNGQVNRQWKLMPKNQLAAAAERQALRKAGLDHKTDTISDIVDTLPPDTPADEPPVVEDPEPEDHGAHSSDKPEDVEPPSSAAGEAKAISIPSGGWKAWDLLDDGRRIMKMGTKDDKIRLALDDGHAVEVKRTGENRGVIILDRKRKDVDKLPRGGFEWKEGDVYYDGSSVRGIKNAKQDGCLILKLDSGFKVKLNTFGRELSRKELKKKNVDSKADSSKKDGGEKAEGPSFALTDEEQAAFDAVRAGLRDVTDTKLKDHIRVLLARWCNEYNEGVRMTPKEAYKKLLGVVLENGKRMGTDDLIAFLEALADALIRKKESA